MADDAVIGSGASTPADLTIAADEIAGKKYQRVKISIGDDGTAADAGASNALPTVDAAVAVLLAAIQTAVQGATPAGTNNIGDVDVLTLPALPAGTNAIGKLGANSGVDIGDVDVTSVAPGVAATSLGKAEDAAHTTGDVGVMALGVRSDTAAALAGTTGDYLPLITDALGRLWVNVGATPTPTASSAAPTSFTATSSTAIFTQNNGALLRTFQNDSDKDLYLMLRAAAVSIAGGGYHVKVAANGGFFSTDYKGEVRGIMSAAIGTGQVNCGEYT